MNPSDASAFVWSGRVDTDEADGDTRRIHQVIERNLRHGKPGVVLLGFASDAGVARNQGRVGASSGPNAIRATLANLAAQPVSLYDAGDVRCVGDALEVSQAAFGRRLTELLHDGHLPIGLGGGHEIAWASWQGISGYLAQHTTPKIGVLNFDAHFDLRGTEPCNSGTGFRQIAQDCQARGWPFHYAVLGISPASNTQALFDRAHALGVWYELDTDTTRARQSVLSDKLQAWLAGLDHVYVTVCLDAFPASVVPGVSAPSALGIDLGLVLDLIVQVQRSGKLRLADVAELNPSLDIDQRSARVAARIVWSLMCKTAPT